MAKIHMHFIYNNKNRVCFVSYWCNADIEAVFVKGSSCIGWHICAVLINVE